MDTREHHYIIRINNRRFHEIVAAAEQTGDECCGFLLGSDQGTRVITTVIAAANVAAGDRRVSFEIDPLEYLRAERYAEQNGLAFLGVYHSHPDCPAVPSKEDLLMAHAGLTYIIVSTRARRFDAIRSWRLDSKRRFIEETLLFLEDDAAETNRIEKIWQT